MTKISAKQQSQSEYCTGCGTCLIPLPPNLTFAARTPTGLQCSDCYKSFYGSLAAEKRRWQEQYDLLTGNLPPLLKLMVERRRGS